MFWDFSFFASSFLFVMNGHGLDASLSGSPMYVMAGRHTTYGWLHCAA